MMQTQWTYSFDENELDDCGNYYPSQEAALNAARIDQVERWEEECGYGENFAVHLSEVIIRNNDENDILRTITNTISGRIRYTPSGRGEHFNQGDYL
jgi:hypothetical protein